MLKFTLKIATNITFEKTVSLKYFLIIIILLFSSCHEVQKVATNQQDSNINNQNKYAKGFRVIVKNEVRILEISKPWPKSEKSYKYLLLNKNEKQKEITYKDNFDGILRLPIENIIVTSTTHIPALELLGVEKTLIGFPNTHYISSEKTRMRVDQGEIRELGKNESINTEVVLQLNPEVVIGYGIKNSNRDLRAISKSGIPVVYNGDWVENTPLGKAEWIKFFGVLYNKTVKADSIFNTIDKNYQNAKTLANKIQKQPTILCGAMHNDIWYMPSGTSPEAQILKDANVNYLWSNTSGKGSLPLSFETVYNKAKQANFWMSPSYFTNYEALNKASKHYSKFESFKNKSIYTFANTKGKTGGVKYYEIGTIRPDLVLKDIIKICHPELLSEYQTTFFKPLE